MIIHLMGFNGFAKQIAISRTLVVFLLSLAVYRLQQDFFHKFYMLKAALATGNHFWLVVCGINGCSECLLLFPCYPGNVF
jgi:NADH:ubiquinone oxidoreductase subunit 2 (subunit N)